MYDIFFSVDPPPYLADHAVDDESVGSASNITGLGGLQKYREAEETATKVLTAMEQLIEKYGAASSS